jgi:PPOX class probable F420-dependent enzyme
VTPEQHDAWDLLISQRVAILGTLNADGSSHLVPFTFASLEPGQLVSAVDQKPKSSRQLRRLGNVRRDPRVTILAHHYEDDWRRLWWVRAAGAASITEIEPRGAGDALRDRYPQYAGQSLGPWLLMKVDSIARWTART